MSAVHRTLATAVALLLAAIVPGCAGASGGETIVKDGFTGQPLPPHATRKVKTREKNCRNGNPQACDWVGVWYLVGGGGQKNVPRAEKYFDFACNHGYRRGCLHLEQMKRGEHEL